MSDKDVLSQDEIDALLDGVDNGSVETGDGSSGSNKVREYDLASQEGVIRGRVPALDLVNDGFTKESKNSWFNLFQDEVEVVSKGLEVQKANEYLDSLPIPSSMTVYSATGLKGHGMVVLDASLVNIIIDRLFGGSGTGENYIKDREFTETELRIIRRLTEQVFQDLKTAWSPIVPLEFSYVKTEMNPAFLGIAKASDILLVNEYKIEMFGQEAALTVVYPYRMLEPLKDKLYRGVQSEDDSTNPILVGELKKEILNVPIEVQSILTETDVSLKTIMQMQVGDVIPFKLPEFSTLFVEGFPSFKTTYGEHEGCLAVKIVDQYDNNR